MAQVYSSFGHYQSVMYIPAMPNTPQNAAYIARQRETFLAGMPPPDFPQMGPAGHLIGIGKDSDVVGDIGRKAMDLAV